MKWLKIIGFRKHFCYICVGYFFLQTKIENLADQMGKTA